MTLESIFAISCGLLDVEGDSVCYLVF